jgi:hypothetical protein
MAIAAAKLLFTFNFYLSTFNCSVIVTNFAIAIVAIGDISATKPVFSQHSELSTCVDALLVTHNS